MNYYLISLLVILAFSFSVASAAEESKNDRYNFEEDFSILEDIKLDIDDGVIFMTHKHDPDATIKITEDYELYINHKKVKTNDRQKQAVQDYYEHLMDIIDSAKEIGLEGAKIGVSGAKIGVQAVLGLLRLLDPDYDSKDLENDLQKEADKIERKAGKLEKKADNLEKLAHDFKKTHSRLKNAVPELKKLSWF